MNNKTLVIILSETRAHELTFDSFKTNVLDELNADLCLCIGIKDDYDYSNLFFKYAKYKFLYNELEDYTEAFDYASNYIINENEENNENNLNWREFLNIKDQFLGGIKSNYNQHEGSGGISIFFRWFLLKNLKENNLINEYERFIITRSDFIYQLPHPQVLKMNENNIWIPDEEYYGGYTDRHVILSKKTIESYLNILNNMVIKSNDYYNKMKNYDNWNIERLLKFNLEENNVNYLVKEMPYIMYSVRNINGTTRWSKGDYNENLGYYIKYHNEYNKSNHYKNLYINNYNSNKENFYNNLYNN